MCCWLRLGLFYDNNRMHIHHPLLNWLDLIVKSYRSSYNNVWPPQSDFNWLFKRIIIKDNYYMHYRNLCLHCMSCFQNHFFFLKQVLFGIINNCVRSVVYLCGLSDLWPPFPLAVFFWRGVSVEGLNECNMSLSRGARTIFSSSVVEKNMFVSYRSQLF